MCIYENITNTLNHSKYKSESTEFINNCYSINEKKIFKKKISGIELKILKCI